jgi:hypothetical protein
VIREALRATPDGNPLRGALVPLARERTRMLSAALRKEMDAGRIARRDPRQVAEHLLHALLGHFVAESIAGANEAPSSGDPVVARVVETIASELERVAPRPRSPRRRTMSRRS